MKLDPQPSPCKGHVFRFRRNDFASNGRLVFSIQWVRIKSLSCKGDCVPDSSSRCYSPLDEACVGGIEHLRIECDHPVVGQLYRSVFTPTNTDFESGMFDEWKWCMAPYNPKPVKDDMAAPL